MPTCFPSGFNAPDDIAWYFGWYAPHATGLMRDESFVFTTGALACHIHSLSASTVRTKSQNWAGPLLARGAAAVLGNVYEPFLSHSTHLDIFYQRISAGDTLAIAAFHATPRISWMTVSIGDPLYRPVAGDE